MEFHQHEHLARPFLPILPAAHMVYEVMLQPNEFVATSVPSPILRKPQLI